MKLTAVISLALLSCSLPGFADVTIRYETAFKPAAALAPLIEQFAKTAQMGIADITTRMKDGKAYVTFGRWIQIFDFQKQEVTLVDPEHKTFATFPVAQLAEQMAALVPPSTPEAAKTLAALKVKSESKITGRTDTIRGVQAEERELTISMDLPLPAGAAQSGPGLKMVMHIWTAKAAEALNNPSIRELSGYNAWQKYILNPMGSIDKLAARMPGLSDTMRPMLEEIFKNQTVVLRTHMEMYMPFLATVASRMASQGQSAPAIDPNAPIMEMNQEVAELSGSPVDASLFAIPKDYTAAPAGDLVKEVFKAQTAAAAAPAKP